MRKIAIVINGKGGVGKDTLCELAARHFKVMNISSITPIKQIAAMCGWCGQKDDKSRKFLSDLKALCIEYNDYPTVWAEQKYQEFLTSEYEVLFVHIREADEIRKFVERTAGAAKTMLVRADTRLARAAYGNVSDDGVENYTYDVYVDNDTTLQQGEENIVAAINSLIL